MNLGELINTTKAFPDFKDNCMIGVFMALFSSRKSTQLLIKVCNTYFWKSSLTWLFSSHRLVLFICTRCNNWLVKIIVIKKPTSQKWWWLNWYRTTDGVPFCYSWKTRMNSHTVFSEVKHNLYNRHIINFMW